MRVILVNDFGYAEGGSSLVALRQANILQEQGHDVLLFTGQAEKHCLGQPGYKKLSGIRAWSTEQPDLLGDRNPVRAALRGIWNIDSARQLGRVISEYDPADTVVLVHSWSKVLSSSVVRKARGAGFPVVVMLHDYSIACPNGVYYDFQSGHHCQRRPMSSQCVMRHCDRGSYLLKLWRVVRQFAQHKFGGLPNDLTKVVAVSEFQRQILRPMMPSTQVDVLRNAVQPFDLNEDDAGKAVCDFVYVGRLSPEKGAVLLAKAAKKLGLSVVFVGDGPERDNILAAYSEARITGWLSPKDVGRCIAAARVLVFPSLLYESFGLTVYEAAALGVPSIAAKNSAATEFIRNEENGMTFTNGDIDSLARAMQRLITDTALRSRLAKQARSDYATYAQGRAETYRERLQDMLLSALPPEQS